jgi:hypothetical protein
VYPTQTAAPQAWQCIAFNISTTGIGVTLPLQLPEGTVLTIQAWGLPGACPLPARIVRASPVEMFWFTGCQLLRPLSDPDLQIWRSGRLDWLD